MVAWQTRKNSSAKAPGIGVLLNAEYLQAADPERRENPYYVVVGDTRYYGKTPEDAVETAIERASQDLSGNLTEDYFTSTKQESSVLGRAGSAFKSFGSKVASGTRAAAAATGKGLTAAGTGIASGARGVASATGKGLTAAGTKVASGARGVASATGKGLTAAGTGIASGARGVASATQGAFTRKGTTSATGFNSSKNVGPNPTGSQASLNSSLQVTVNPLLRKLGSQATSGGAYRRKRKQTRTTRRSKHKQTRTVRKSSRKTADKRR